MENTVEQILAGSVQDDAAQAQQENTQPLSEFMNEQKKQAQPEAPAPKEPGWIKQRVNAAVDKAVAEAEARGASAEELRGILGTAASKRGIFEGDIDNGELEIGQVASYIKDVRPVSEIMDALVSEYEECRRRLLGT